MSGSFFAVVGPSGAGKDSLIDFARGRLATDPRFAFPARCITRPATAGGEDHIEIAPDAFAALRAEGGFVLDWEAHGLCYGIPAHIADEVEAGTSVIVNLSRGVVDDARRKFHRARVVHVTAPPEVIAGRLAARGRESKADIEARLRRASSAGPSGDDVFRLDNAGSLEDAGTSLVDFLVSHGPQAVHA